MKNPLLKGVNKESDKSDFRYFHLIPLSLQTFLFNFGHENEIINYSSIRTVFGGYRLF
ncbi:hypothetical protein A33Q_0863 [Indibacter alkaliphilus LW1]|uniref:Uncharacterized protein n=1 Tax=Indibacter alkaliphilus (strain CCUG 57479 / KCTC 22604 / LW1) TaxID=1189612 RepID=S2E9M6_INDAL|nr:hypothetical protein A33Q_0863 [Indibacter alkaliphilus LW1]